MLAANEILVMAHFRARTPPHNVMNANEALFVKVGSKRTRSEQGELDPFDPTIQKKFKTGNPEDKAISALEDQSRSQIQAKQTIIVAMAKEEAAAVP